jgi:hypothetical protein
MEYEPIVRGRMSRDWGGFGPVYETRTPELD